MTLIRKGAAAIITVSMMTTMLTACNAANSDSGLNKGEGINVEESIYEKIDQTIEGKQVETDRLIKTIYECNVVNKDNDGNEQIKVTIKDAYIKEQDDKQVTTEYDSIEGQTIKDPLASPTITVYSAAAGESFNVVIDNKGNVKEVKDAKELDNKILDKLNISDEQIKSKLEPIVSHEFGESAIKCKLQNILINQRSNGDSWENQQKDNLSLSDVTVNYKVSKIDSNSCYIDENDNGTNNIKSECILDDGTRVNYYGDYQSEGSLQVDKENGAAIKENIDCKFNGDFEYTNGPKEVKGKKIPTTIEFQIFINKK